jgi:phage shock protein C
MNRTYKTLYRSRSNRLIGGVAAGIGDYMGIDPTVVRLLFVFIALVGWVAPAVIVYLVMLFVVPEEPIATMSTTASTGPVPEQPAPAGTAHPDERGAVVYEVNPVEPEQSRGDSVAENTGNG